MTNESSVSRCDDREFRFVEPNRVSTGAEFGVGEIHMPVVERTGGGDNQGVTFYRAGN